MIKYFCLHTSKTASSLCIKKTFSTTTAASITCEIPAGLEGTFLTIVDQFCPAISCGDYVSL